jgi:legumain
MKYTLAAALIAA